MKDIIKQNIINKLIKGIFVLLGGIIACYIALVLVYLLPTDIMEQHVMESRDLIEAEGISPFLLDGYPSTRLDNYSDGLILNSAIYSGDESVWEKAAAIYQHRYGDEDYYISLIKHLDGIEGEITTSYERDWHGYLVYVKPLLLCMNYADIRLVNMVLQIAVVCLLLYEMYKKKIERYIPAFVMTLFFLTWNILFFSIEYSAMFYVFMTASLWVLKKNDSIVQKRLVPELFLIVGMVVSYIDVLTYPILTIGIPLVFLFILNREWSEDIGKIVANIATACFWWICGYGGMWAGKWVIASIVLKINVIKEAILMALYRMSQTSGETGVLIEFTSKDVFANNFGVYAKPAYIIALVVFLIWFVRRVCKDGIELSIRAMLPNMIIALMPVVWYLALGNHSYIHYWMTHRNIVLIVFSICCMSISMIKINSKDKQRGTDD